MKFAVFARLSLGRNSTFAAPYVLGAALGLGACYSAPDAAQTAEIVIGTAPLRRLSNDEYRNSLRDLFPGSSFEVPTLPADLVVLGFENAAEAQAPSDVRISRYEAVAQTVAAAFVADAPSLATSLGCSWSTATDADACAAHFVSTFGKRIFRRPLTEDEAARSLAKFRTWQTAVDFPAAVQLSLASFLQAPQFLYRPELDANCAKGASCAEVEPLDAYALATRLSYFLWESTPDDALLDAARDGKLATEEGLRREAQRLMADAKFLRVAWNFHRQWLGLGRILEDEHVVRTPAVDDEWTVATPQALLAESRGFLETTVSGGGSFRDLLLSRASLLNSEAARVYGVSTGATELPSTERAGILTRAAFLAATSHRGGTSPPIRGNALYLRVLCGEPLSPPPDANLAPPTIAPGEGPKTNRTLFEERTAPSACFGCHVMLNGLGFGFENYNAAGKFQTVDNTLPVNAGGDLVGTDVDGPFHGVADLSKRLAESKSAQNCFAERWARYAFARPPAKAEQRWLTGLAATVGSGKISDVIEQIVLSPSFRTRLRGSR